MNQPKWEDFINDAGKGVEFKTPSEVNYPKYHEVIDKLQELSYTEFFSLAASINLTLGSWCHKAGEHDAEGIFLTAKALAVEAATKAKEMGQ